jgi:hypothetical protein
VVHVQISNSFSFVAIFQLWMMSSISLPKGGRVFPAHFAKEIRTPPLDYSRHGGKDAAGIDVDQKFTLV